MNIFLHDFTTLADFNDVAQWIKNSELDPAKNTIAFIAALDHDEDMRSFNEGCLLLGDKTKLLTILTGAISQVCVSQTRSKESALRAATMVSAAAYGIISSDYDQLKRRGGEQ